MKTIITLLLITTFAFSHSVNAQVSYTGFSDVTLTLRSDSTTHSALLTNLLEDRVGDISPIIGAAAWTENNKKLQCRSLLYFDYAYLPKFIKPEQITEAILVLKPVEILTQESVTGATLPRVAVRRVTSGWDESATTWLTQPTTTTKNEVIKSIPEKRKLKNVNIEVTDIVRDMFREGNKGFMIRYEEDSLETTTFLSQWFASAKYDETKYRPELIIRWSQVDGFNNPYPVFPNMSSDPFYRTRNFEVNMTQGSSAPIPHQSPVNTQPVSVPLETGNSPKPKQ